ncbi:MAG: DUF1573 domain-containing protein [Clostridium sp.]|nr:DUF1573 domain-containing protein [Clostridium sp.]
MELIKRIILIHLILAFSCSCNQNRTKQTEMVSMLAGKQITLPDNLVCKIQNDTIAFDFAESDYTIVVYLDSAGCTPCRMKLPAWDEVIDEMNSKDGVDVRFLMVINAEINTDSEFILKRDKFKHPVSYDPEGTFIQKNDLPEEDVYHTFLLDHNGEIVLIGNPVFNPKVRELFLKVISRESDGVDALRAEAMGVIKTGDTAAMSFQIENLSDADLSLQGIIPSCDCVSAVMDKESINSGEGAVLTVRYIADETIGYFRRYVDLYYREKETPDRYMIYGFKTNK